MSQETSTWLNTHTLIGFTDKRGHAWHYRAADQGDEPNHYPGPVPVTDVQRRLFGWDAVRASVFAEYLNEHGFVRLTDADRQAVVRPAGAFGSADPGGSGQRIKVRHSRHSRLRLGQAREALQIVHTIADDFAAQVARLTATTVTGRQWAKFLDAHVELPTGGAPSRSRTIAERKRQALGRLWNHDPRVSPWRGTAWGVVQAVNTYTHHEQTVRSMDRAERNMLRAVEGDADILDTATLTTLRQILA